MKGSVYVDPDGFVEDEALREWVSLCENFSGALPAKVGVSPVIEPTVTSEHLR